MTINSNGFWQNPAAPPGNTAQGANPYQVGQGGSQEGQIYNQQITSIGGGQALPVWGQGGGDANSYANQLGTLGAAMGSQQAPSATGNQFAGSMTADQGSLTSDNAAEQAQLAQLMSQAQGTAGPSAADMQMRAQTQQAQGQSQSLAMGGAGSSGSLAMRGAQNQNAQLSINNANATAQVDAQQRQAALAQYNQLAGQYSQQQLAQEQNMQGFGAAQAAMQGQQNQYNIQNQLNAQQQAQQAQYAQLTADSNYWTGSENVMTQDALAANAANNSFNNTATSAGIGLGAAALIALSDANAKENIQPAGDADSFIEALTPYTFDYKRETGEPAGKHLGVIAQNLEATPFGQTLITNTPRGKAIKVAPALGAALASVGRINQRLRKLEARAR